MKKPLTSDQKNRIKKHKDEIADTVMAVFALPFVLSGIVVTVGWTIGFLPIWLLWIASAALILFDVLSVVCIVDEYRAIRQIRREVPANN